MKNLVNRNLIKKLIWSGIFIYVLCIFMNQQKTINAYQNEKKSYEEKISQANQYNNELLAIKENVNSPEYIEKVAREKLDMYLPNERVYIDINQ